MLFIGFVYNSSCACYIALFFFHESHAWHIFPRVAADTEVAYELVAEPIQEPQAGEQQEDAVEHALEEIANPADLQGKPRSITFIFKYSMLLFKYCALSF